MVHNLPSKPTGGARWELGGVSSAIPTGGAAGGLGGRGQSRNGRHPDSNATGAGPHPADTPAPGPCVGATLRTADTAVAHGNSPTESVRLTIFANRAIIIRPPRTREAGQRSTGPEGRRRASFSRSGFSPLLRAGRCDKRICPTRRHPRTRSHETFAKWNSPFVTHGS